MVTFIVSFLGFMVLIIAGCSIFGAAVALATTPMPKIKKATR